MNQALFESLTGVFVSGTSVDSVAGEQRRSTSILDHLNRMFNTREGTLPHLVDYGLPDISEIYRKMPHGIKELQLAIKRCVERYEPRLKNVRVQFKENKPTDFRMVFLIQGDYKRGGGTVRFQTTFMSNGDRSVAYYPKQIDK
jgi:type VI secretion system protein